MERGYLKVGDKIKVTTAKRENTYTVFKVNKIKAFAEDTFGRIEQFKIAYENEENILPNNMWYAMDGVKRELIK